MAVINDRDEIQNWAGLANNGQLTVVVLVCTGLFGLYRYLRSVICPCITPFELDLASRILDDTYQAAERDVPDWDDIANDYLSLRIEATHIREKSLQGSSWKTCLGFHPALMFDIAYYHTKCEELKCRILTAHERNLRSHLGAEQYRRQFSTTTRLPPQTAFFASAYESPFRSLAQYEDYSPRPYNAEI
ncbi:hypothetical protein E1B28_010523 [Marasmius oreades]|uniref:Uncharacterized protein n=1 Tax=Marasmius oreades TaxID=181124 RepID=A0A9P7RXY8_9AGAR|nr:uncharacterized protein E1B28_010523 [Marasmius oreades]KAG7091492.1 hypothetical protein E1B28_010523 [Marasmius oreades]